MLVPALITIFYTVNSFKDAIRKFLKTNNIYDQIKSKEILIIIVFYVIVPFGIAIYNFVKQTSTDTTATDELTALLVHISNTVEEKSKRYYSPQFSANRNIKDVIKPNIQILEIKKNITSYFQTIYKDSTIKSNIFINKNGSLVTAFHDEPTTVSMKVINRKDSTAITALTQKKMIIIPDTVRPGIPFFPGDSSESTIKSIICYPIIIKSKVKYIISLTSKKSTFKKDLREKYKYVLDEFSKRILLESFLFDILKEGGE
jgi:hypothetical protein